MSGDGEVEPDFQGLTGDISGNIDEAVPEELDEFGVKVWQRTIKELKLAGWLRPPDREALIRYCDLVSKYWKMSKTVQDEGETIKVPTIAKDADGNPGMFPRRHPLLSELRQTNNALAQLESNFGMSPSSRASLINANLRRRVGDGDLFGKQGAVPEASKEDHGDPGTFH